jgi:hypothetical protein
MEDELSGNLRTLRPLGTADLITERFDSVYRRNLLEPEPLINADKKRNRKVKYKYHDKTVHGNAE